MASITFWEKPGCINNTKQKRLLVESGHTVEARDLLAEAWTPDRLRPFFGDRPLAEWFNKAAPRVTSGEVVPGQWDEAETLAAMVADPLLIRRPLILADGRPSCGFDGDPALEVCPRTDGGACLPPIVTL